MSVRKGNDIISGTYSNKYLPNLFDIKWADHKLNNPSWLRADTFSWQNAVAYQAAYQHLFEDISKEVEGLYAWSSSNNVFYVISLTPAFGDPIYVKHGQIFVNEGILLQIEGNNAQIYWNGTMYGSVRETSLDEQKGIIIYSTPTTETINGITITYYQAPDGHKLVLPDQESNVQAIYNATGVAWYYILDTENQRFKLPRTKFGFTGLRDTVGKYVEAGLPNISGSFVVYTANNFPQEVDGAFSVENSTHSGESYQYVGNSPKFKFNASDSNSIYGSSTTVQPPATQMYLYFYMGPFTQTALENTAGLNAELFNNKVDKGHEVIAFQAPTADNNYTWYRKYADGWVEQGGVQTGATSGSVSVSLPVTMADTHYFVQVTSTDKSLFGSGAPDTTTQATVETRGHDYSVQPCRCSWQVSGIAA